MATDAAIDIVRDHLHVWSRQRCTDDEPGEAHASVFLQSNGNLSSEVHAQMATSIADSTGAYIVKTALIVLNFHVPQDLLEVLWEAAHLRWVADGGAVRLYRAQEGLLANDKPDGGDGRASNAKQSILIPDAVVGDGDSLLPDVAEYYRARGSRIIIDSDQDTTDLQKCLNRLLDIQNNIIPNDDSSYRGVGSTSTPAAATELSQHPYTRPTRFRVVVLGAFGGRLDHHMANMNALLMYYNKFEQMTLISESSLATVVPANKRTLLRLHPDVEGPECGLLPLAGPVDSLTTEGLKWDVSGWRTYFGGHLSTSNIIQGRSLSSASTGAVSGSSDSGLNSHIKEVIVQSSSDVIWTSSINTEALTALFSGIKSDREEQEMEAEEERKGVS